MLVILLNCVTLGMFQPCEDVSCQSEWCRVLQVSVTPVCIVTQLTLKIFNSHGAMHVKVLLIEIDVYILPRGIAYLFCCCEALMNPILK